MFLKIRGMRDCLPESGTVPPKSGPVVTLSTHLDSSKPIRNNKRTTYCCCLVQLLQFFVQPHFNGEPLPDQTHLVVAVLGGEELLPALLYFTLVFEVDVEASLRGRSLRRQDAARSRPVRIAARYAALHLGRTSLKRYRENKFQ